MKGPWTVEISDGGEPDEAEGLFFTRAAAIERAREKAKAAVGWMEPGYRVHYHNFGAEVVSPGGFTFADFSARRVPGDFLRFFPRDVIGRFLAEVFRP